MAFQVLTREQASEFMGAKRQSSPRGEVSRYMEYVKQVVADDIAGMIEIRPELPEGATQKEISSRANVEVSRIKAAANQLREDIIVVKRGDRVIFRPVDEGETPNAGPNAPERQPRAKNGSMTVAELQAAEMEDDEEDEEDEDEEEENTAETAITGAARSRGRRS